MHSSSSSVPLHTNSSPFLSLSPILSCAASCEFAYLIWSYSNSFACVCTPHNDNLEQSNNNRWLAATAYRQSYRNSNAQQIGVNRGTWVGDIQWLCSVTPSRVVQFEFRNYRYRSTTSWVIHMQIFTHIHPYVFLVSLYSLFLWGKSL